MNAVTIIFAHVRPQTPSWIWIVVPIIYGLKWRWVQFGASEALYKWAADKGFRILECENTWLILNGPFAMHSIRRNAAFFDIKVLDRTGQPFVGRAKVKGYCFGLRGAKVMVRWFSDPDRDAPESDLEPLFPVRAAEPADDETSEGPRCVACRHPITPGTKFCPKCDWTQPPPRS